MQKEQFSEWGWGVGVKADVENGTIYADHIFIQIYFRMHHFVVKFSNFSSPQAARGIDPLNQNPADALAAVVCLCQCQQAVNSAI